MTQILAEREIQLTKSLGQNFLHDTNQLRRIVEAAELGPADRVLEIGPGLGPLTGPLLERSREVLAIEKDGRLIEFLEQEFSDNINRPVQSSSGRLELIHGDALEFLKNSTRDWSGWKVVSNLPYSVASPILVEIATAEKPPERVVATLQIEVAKRLMAQAGSADYGLLTLLVQLAYEPSRWFKIPASCFFPQPDVDSACILMLRRRAAALASESRDTFVRVVKRSFSQRRKMMLKVLKQDWSADVLEAAFKAAGISPSARAESIDLTQFGRLAEYLKRYGRGNL